MTARQNVLITGAAGMLGNHVIDRLIADYDLSGLDRRQGPADIRWYVGEIGDADLLTRAVDGMDAVIHIAAIPNIWSGGAEAIFDTNVVATYRLMLAAEDAGVKRVVFCSSDSAVGFTVRDGEMIPPEYLPIDEDHPLNPTEPYGLSKALSEEICRSFAQRGRMSAVVLRPLFVAYPEMYGEIRARAASPSSYSGTPAGGPSSAGGGVCWNYVDPRDVAEAFARALTLSGARFETFFVGASSTLAPEPTLDRLRAYLGYLPEVRSPEVYERNPYASLFDTRRMHDRLGVLPTHDLRPMFDLPEV